MNAGSPTGHGGAALIKSELVQIIANRNPHLYQRDVEHIVNAILDAALPNFGAQSPIATGTGSSQ